MRTVSWYTIGRAFVSVFGAPLYGCGFVVGFIVKVSVWSAYAVIAGFEAGKGH